MCIPLTAPFREVRKHLGYIEICYIRWYIGVYLANPANNSRGKCGEAPSPLAVELLFHPFSSFLSGFSVEFNCKSALSHNQLPIGPWIRSSPDKRLRISRTRRIEQHWTALTRNDPLTEHRICHNAQCNCLSYTNYPSINILSSKSVDKTSTVNSGHKTRIDNAELCARIIRGPIPIDEKKELCGG